MAAPSSGLTYGHPSNNFVVFPVRFQPKSRQSADILFSDSFINGDTTTNSFTIVMRHTGPPISFSLDIAQNHIFNWSRRPGTFQGIFAFQHRQASDKCCKIILMLVCLNTLRHHVKDIVKDCSTKFQIVMTFRYAAL